MSIKRIAMAIIGTSLRVMLLAVIVMYIHKVSLTAYDFGYRIFAEEPVSSGTGRDVEVTVPMGKNAREVGEILEDKGLIRDANLFFCQEILSAYHKKIQPGVYTLNTTMTAEQMLAVMAADAPEDSKEQDKGEESD